MARLSWGIVETLGPAMAKLQAADANRLELSDEEVLFAAGNGGIGPCGPVFWFNACFLVFGGREGHRLFFGLILVEFSQWYIMVYSPQL